MSYTNYGQLQIERRDRALWVTMNNLPLNPITAVMHGELARLFGEINHDERTRVVVLTGAGDAFSAGGDINDMSEKRTDTRHHMQMLADGARIVHGLLALEAPIIARINGHAIGLGATLALFCDITVAVDQAKIADPHVRVGLAAGDGGALIWPQLVGFARAREYLLTGNSLTATHAAHIGLINHAVPTVELDAKVMEFVDYFANGPIEAIKATKRAINQVLQQYAASLVEAHLGLEARSIFSSEHEEAVAAMLEKRKPVYR
jgi:enoyl-CoA hydratase